MPSLMASIVLIALPLAAGCGGGSETTGTPATTSAAATVAVSAACSSALEKADKASNPENSGPDPAAQAAVIASLDACTGDEYIAATNAAIPGANAGPRDFIAMCDGNRTDSGEWPAGCAAVATLTDPKWKAACADYLATWDNDEPSVCGARKT